MPGGAKEKLILFAWMKKSLNRQAGGKRGEWSAAYLYPRIGLRLCGWPQHADSEEAATVNYLKFLIMLFTASCRAPRLSLQI